MKVKEIDTIELKFLDLDDYKELKEVMLSSYVNMPGSYWREAQIASLIDKFPDGQVVIKINGQ
ncbi:MAG: hypothetical protein ACFCUL_05570 [Flavobacteriaceae bacterium]